MADDTHSLAGRGGAARPEGAPAGGAASCAGDLRSLPPRSAAVLTQRRAGAGRGDPRNIITLFPWPTLKQNRVWEEKLEGEVEQHMERCGVETSGKLLVLLQGN